MNIGQIGFAASIVAQSIQTRATEAERVQQENAAQSLVTESAKEAEMAEGIGVTHEEAPAGDRDADGRLPWQMQSGSPAAEESNSNDETNLPPQHPRDPSGVSGTLLDLDG